MKKPREFHLGMDEITELVVTSTFWLRSWNGFVDGDLAGSICVEDSYRVG